MIISLLVFFVDKIESSGSAYFDPLADDSVVNVKKMRVAIEGVQGKKKDGAKVNLFFEPSNLMINELNLDDKRRLESLTRKIPVKKQKEEKIGKKVEEKKQKIEKSEIKLEEKPKRSKKSKQENKEI